MNPKSIHSWLWAVTVVVFLMAGCGRDEAGVFDPVESAKAPWSSDVGLLRGSIALDAEGLDAAAGASIFVYRSLDDFRNHVADLLRATELIPRDDPHPEYFVVETPVEREGNRLTFEVALEPGEYLMMLWKDTQGNGMIDADDPFFFVCTDGCPTPTIVEVRAGTISWIHSRPLPDIEVAG